MSKAQLYNDLHPDKSLKNTGFKDSATANHTINLISKRSLRYQFLWRFKISLKFLLNI